MADEPVPPAPPEDSSAPAVQIPAASPARPATPQVPPGGSGPPRPRPSRERKERSDRGPRPELTALREPLYRETRGYRMRLEPPDLAKLKELPGSRGKSEAELGGEFFDAQAERLAAALAEDVPAPAEVRVVVDPFSRQVFLAVGKKITAILSF